VGGRAPPSLMRGPLKVSPDVGAYAAALWRRHRRHRQRSEQTSVSERPGTNGSPHSTQGRGSCFTRRATLYDAAFSGLCSPTAGPQRRGTAGTSSTTRLASSNWAETGPKDPFLRTSSSVSRPFQPSIRRPGRINTPKAGFLHRNPAFLAVREAGVSRRCGLVRGIPSLRPAGFRGGPGTMRSPSKARYSAGDVAGERGGHQASS
jgi:hypothetical protein